MAGDFYSIALVCISGYFLLTAVSNVLYLRGATKAPRAESGPFVSLIVPARNEEGCIARCLDSLLAQRYKGYEAIVVDDESSDATADIVSVFAARDSRVHLVSGKLLPEGWLGKPHALSQGVAAARGEVLLLTDADTVHRPSSISWAVTNLQEHGADLLSGYLHQTYGMGQQGISGL